MKKKLSKFLAVILSMAIVISPVTAYAESSREDVAKRAKIVDCLLETVLDPVFKVIINSLMKAESISNRYPSAEEYFSEKQPYFYEGTDGKVTENKQFEPDVKVELPYSDFLSGKDPQLEAAVKGLLKEIK